MSEHTPMDDIRRELSGISKKLDVVDEMKISVVRIEEQQKALIKESEHRHNNVKQSIDQLATKRDLDLVEEQIRSGDKVLEARLEAIEEDVDGLKKVRDTAYKSGVGAIAAVVTALAYFGKTKFGG